MKRVPRIKTLAWRCGAVAIALALVGCSSSSVNESPARKPVARTLSPSAAAELAAKLANEECERLYKKRPFTAARYPAVLEGDSYRWGRLEPGAPHGLSAVVTFGRDGSNPNVKIYFSTDQASQTFPRFRGRDLDDPWRK